MTGESVEDTRHDLDALDAARSGLEALILGVTIGGSALDSNVLLAEAIVTNLKSLVALWRARREFQ